MTRQKVALVTGASSGIGQATAALLAKQGFRVFGSSRRPGESSGGASPAVEMVRLDVCDDESVRSAVGAVLERAGRIDALVNNAGSTLVGSLEETSVEEAKELFETNFFGVLRMTQAVLPIMRGQAYGRIVNISSILGFLPAPYQAIYAATKHAIEGYAESVDHEVRQFGIRVSLVEPGYIKTNLDQNGQLVAHTLNAYAAERNSVRQKLREGIANGEDPLAVASVVLEALTSRSPRARYRAGRQAKFLSQLRKFAPAGFLDKGLRKNFGLDVA